MTKEPKVPVRPLLRVVANGTRQDKNGKWLKFTLIATPEFDSASPILASEGAFELENWPLEMASRLRQGLGPFGAKASLSLFARSITPSAIPAVPDWLPPIPLRAAAASAFEKPKRWEAINRLWQQSLAQAGSRSWNALASDIERSIGGKKHQSDLKDTHAGPPEFDVSGAIIADPPPADQTITIEGVVPIKQSDFALEEQGERAARVLAKQLRGAFAVNDEDHEPDLRSARQQFDDAVAATNSLRASTKAANQAVSRLVSGKDPGAPADAPKAASVVPAPVDVIVPAAGDQKDPTTGDRAARRASHHYGMWLQRRSQYKARLNDKGEVVLPDVSKPTEYNDADLDKVRAAYFALQGDPVLSRLFCLAIDFEVEATALGHLDGELLHLALAPPSAPRRAAIATAARRHDDGFWPVSAFEALVVFKEDNGAKVAAILDQPDLAEQRDGIWKLGATTKVTGSGGEVEFPRYDLVSLDLRRSVDGKTTGQDRGEAHQTGGFTVLDRGRGDQIARDLALSAYTRALLQTADVVVLHAEDLTIGRHVDVAAASGDDPIAGLKWRSLMRRYVDFDFGDTESVAESVLKDMFPAKAGKGVPEEVSFQVAARFMPVKDQAYEAVAEEAIYTWDGSPAGVLTDAGAAGQSTPSPLPFSHRLDLPGAETAKAAMRPAPLRFGYPYLFRFRSAFLGGGSPDPNGADTARNMNDACTLPAGNGNGARPRRFLRHESINAPVLMLPAHLAQRPYDRMGYEQADQAIVRSWNNASSGLKDADDKGIAGDYVIGLQRARPDSTMRVLVAPEVGLDLVVRHGLMDGGNAGEVRRGGLIDAAYTPKPSLLAPASGTAPRPSGFPVAVTSVCDTLDAEGAIYQRKVDTAEDASESGIPVFEPGGINGEPRGSVGYLPDPAIDHFSIRARIRGSDRYLDGDLRVAVYDGKAYPHALPLVVNVTKRGKDAASVRPAHPKAIGDIAEDAGTAWLAPGGTLTKARPAHGARVRQLNVRLYPGEDFDLEIACLPTPDMFFQRFALPETVALQLKLAGPTGPAFENLKQICGDKIATACARSATTQSMTGIGGAELPDAPALKAVATDILTAIRGKWPIEEVAAVTTLRVCHAVNKPALAARFQDTGTLQAVRMGNDMPCEAVVTPDLKDMEEAVGLFLKGKVEVDLSLIDSFQLVAETVGADGAPLDTRQRGRSMISRRTGRWPTLTTPAGEQAYVAPTDVVGFRVAEDGSVELPKHSVTLLSVGNLPTVGAIGKIVKLTKGEKGLCSVPAGGAFEPEPDGTAGEPVFSPAADRMTAIELAPLFAAASTGAPITQQIAMQQDARDVTRRTRTIKTERSHIFRDTLARKLSLKLVSLSRHAHAFETAPTYVGGKEQLLYRRQPLKRLDQAVLGAEVAEVWMRSTRRPAVPDALRPEPSFVISRSSAISESGVRSHFFKRHALTRLYLARGWFSSGEGERLGIVLWPPNYDTLSGDDIDKDKIKVGDRVLNLRDYADADLGPGGAFVTRWGGDPIRKDQTPQSGNFIPPDAFGDLAQLHKGPHRPNIVRSALLPIRRQPKPDSADQQAKQEPVYDYLPVTLLTFEPCFDLDREEWYVDVDLKPIRASEPFVRFGLVRYQEHSICEKLKLSEPVTVTMQLLAERNVEIAESKVLGSDDRHVSISVYGLGSSDIKDIDLDTLEGKDEDKQQWRSNFAALRRPKVKLSLFHETKDDNGAILRTPLSKDDLRFEKDRLILPKQDPRTLESEPQFELPEARLENATLIWSTTFDLQRSALDILGGGRIVAYLEEVDRRMPASYRKEPVSLGTMFSADTFVESGPRFSARLPFFESP